MLYRLARALYVWLPLGMFYQQFHFSCMEVAVITKNQWFFTLCNYGKLSVIFHEVTLYSFGYTD